MYNFISIAYYLVLFISYVFGKLDVQSQEVEKFLYNCYEYYKYLPKHSFVSECLNDDPRNQSEQNDWDHLNHSVLKFKIHNI